MYDGKKEVEWSWKKIWRMETDEDDNLESVKGFCHLGTRSRQEGEEAQKQQGYNVHGRNSKNWSLFS